MALQAILTWVGTCEPADFEMPHPKPLCFCSFDWKVNNCSDGLIFPCGLALLFWRFQCTSVFCALCFQTGRWHGKLLPYLSFLLVTECSVVPLVSGSASFPRFEDFLLWNSFVFCTKFFSFFGVHNLSFFPVCGVLTSVYVPLIHFTIYHWPWWADPLVVFCLHTLLFHRDIVWWGTLHSTVHFYLLFHL